MLRGEVATRKGSFTSLGGEISVAYISPYCFGCQEAQKRFMLIKIM